MMKNTQSRLAILLILVSMLISACSAGPAAKPTEKEIIINPNEGQTEAEGTPIPTPTLRPTPTATPEPAEPVDAPTPTSTLTPYDTLLFEGAQLRIQEQFDAAIAKFGEAIQMDSTNPEGYIQRGITYSNIGKQDEAIIDFNFAINYDPASAEAYNSRGNAWAQKDEYTQAINDYTKAIELKPDLVKAYTNRAIAYMLQQKPTESLAEFSKVIELTPDDAEAYYNRGQAYITALNIASEESYINLCIADFNQAIALQPDNPESFFNRGLCEFFRDNNVRAFENYSKAIELDFEQARYYLYRASLFPELTSMEQALSDVRKVLELSQDDEMKKVAEQMLTEIPKTPTPTPGATPTPLD